MAATLKTPLKLAVVGFAEPAAPGAGTPVIRTVPELPGTKPFDAVVVTVTIPAASVRVEIKAEVDFLVTSMPCRAPEPPGDT